MKPTIILRSGTYFDFTQPESSEFTIEDIASALSKICRFTGHTQKFYSVAQHSVIVSWIVPKKDALAGLLHDAAEAFVGDMASPLKMLLPEYREIERRVERAVLSRFEIGEMPASVKKADLIALATEKRDLLPESENWALLDGVTPLVGRKIYPFSPKIAEEAFLGRYRDLTGERDG